MNTNNPIVRYVIFIVGIIAFQYLLGTILAILGVDRLIASIIIQLAMAFVFAYLYYPAPFRKYALRDPKFHMNVAIFFVIFFLINLIF
jgi:heme A synthase